MVQKEIKNKTQIYGLVGILSAIVLIAMIYSFGTTPLITSPSASPLPSALPTSLATNTEASAMQTFASYSDLNNFVATNNAGGYDTFGRPLPMPTAAPVPVPEPQSPLSVSGEGFKGFSTTNIQVAGVDEADSVKTDGTYLYVIANNSIYILNAGSSNPQNAEVLGKIFINNTYLSGMYLSQDGNKLAVLGNQYETYSPESKDTSLILPYWSLSTTFVHVYDVTNKFNPSLTRNFSISGNYVNSRMIGNYVYTVVNENIQVENGEANLPVIFSGTSASNIEPSRIYYTIAPDSYSTYTTITTLNIMDDAKKTTETTVMMGYASTMFVSAENIFVTYQNWNGETQETSIYRIHINQDNLAFEAKGVVPGYPINQYAMDEYNGYFRIAITAWLQEDATASDGAVFKVSRQLNSIYVLDMNLNIIGKLERFKMDETIYSVRFMGDKCYVVTFKQVDPFFVIDMSDPTAPIIAGELKIPGYSSYLHPYGDSYVIGIGKENSTLKLSLFDIRNVNAPTEIAKYIVDATYSDSSAIYDPHAFLFDAQRQLLVIPVSINDMPIFITREPATGIGTAETSESDYWQGAYVFNVNSDSGFTLKGSITQIDSNTSTQNADYYWNGNYMINRSLYIDNTLYTLSNAKVQLNSIDTLALLAQIELR